MYRYVLVLNDKFSKSGRTVPLKNKNAHTGTNFFENIPNSSKKKTDLIESDNGTKFVNKTFTNLFNNNNIGRYARNTTLGAVFAQRFTLTVRDLLEKPDEAEIETIWVDVSPTITKQSKSRKLSSTKLKPIEASLKKDER